MGRLVRYVDYKVVVADSTHYATYVRPLPNFRQTIVSEKRCEDYRIPIRVRKEKLHT